MSSYNLEHLLAPASVAVVGASDRPGSVGATVWRNLVGGGFRGALWPVNRRHTVVAGVRTYATPAQLPAVPDLAVICTPAPGIPALIGELGARGTRAAIVLSAGLEGAADSGGTLCAATLDAARSCGLRLLGPNCIGLLVPHIGLNASFAHVGARAGGIAFVAQSGALMSALLDWAQSAGVGFSHCVSLGNAADVDFGDLLDYLARHVGRVFTRDQLLDAVWRDTAYVTPRSVDVYVRRIREKIESDPENPRYLRTVRGTGYRFESPK